jgi:hypothetical protein
MGTSHINGRVRRQGSLTGRDGYIVAQALYWFIRTQQALPKKQFEWSNTEDAKFILLNLFPGWAEHFVGIDEYLGCEPANLELEKYGDKVIHVPQDKHSGDNVVDFPAAQP